ncbi:MAG TPA: aldolase/citrate lyase family protein [Phenylobacterium sp.]|uniref:HpcH/HpaI aldolase family protein n=1 Tax=Phenylobacterium sp. TaxID=1871053 RepID=UPI002B4A0D55|nr:aldolase/citrate lyase family protein [Phenylobacterium sp.]HKR89324.1 aldolase/citrate lyase family protein [Phenylobacterium sp.]
MDLPVNTFKRRLEAGERQIGLWLTLANPFAAEAVAGAGFDWLLLDMEHSPADVETVLAQLQAVSAYAATPIVRPPTNDAVVIKRLLDIGAQGLLIPYVQSAEEAAAAVAAIRYPPRGIRGVSASTRATRFGRIPDYGRRADTELCLLVQVETEAALQHLEAIATVDGVSGVFIGPGDLAASMGYVGQPGHPAVQAAVLDAISRLRRLNVPAGLLTGDAAFAEACLAQGAGFVAVGVDAAMLARAADALAGRFCAPSDPTGG